MAHLTSLIENSPSTSDNTIGVRRSLDVPKREKLIKRYYDSGENHRLAGRHKEAKDDFLRVIALNGNHAKAHANLGEIYRIMKQYDNAKQHLLKAI